jgi:LuxR family maltose regulon positive regulatory protein
VPDWALRRPRITKLIAEATRWCPLTVVTGPVGAGKTMALTLWTAAQAGPVAWVCLDEYDNRPGIFWANVLAALRESGVAVPKTLPAARGRPSDHVFLLRLASVLAAQNPPVTLVLDDIHLLTEPKVLTGLDFVLRNVGSGLRLAVCSRSDPLLPLHRYRLTGDLAEIRAADLAFTTAETGLLMTQHGFVLAEHSLELLMRRTEGWAAGLRLVAISMHGHPDPDQFIKELTAEDSALTSYLVEEVLHTQPPEVQKLLLSTSILNQVTPEAASELAGDDQAGRILAGLAHANSFVQPVGGGRYRYHAMFAEVLRLKLRRECPGRATDLHRRAACWYRRRGALADAVRHAAQADGWPLAARIVVDELAVSEIIEPGHGQSLAQEFAAMPQAEALHTPQLGLVSAAVALSADGPELASAVLAGAEGAIGRLPAEQHAACHLAASEIRLAAARRTGNLTDATAAAASAETLVSAVPAAALARHPEIQPRVLHGQGAVALWSGHLDQAARVLETALASAATSGGERLRADCLGHLALVEALRGRLSRAAELAAQATGPTAAAEQHPPAHRPNPAALIALAWVHLEQGELPKAGSLLKRANAALRSAPDKLLGAVTCLAAARGYLADGRAALAAPYLAKARSGWSVPAWLDQKLNLAQPEAAAAPAGSKQPPRGQAHRQDHRPARLDAPVQAVGPLIVEPLTAREREVLRHLADMLSTAEVASEMYISVNTVKAHLKSIFRKLAAAHRGEAVRRARELGLILGLEFDRVTDRDLARLHDRAVDPEPGVAFAGYGAQDRRVPA